MDRRISTPPWMSGTHLYGPPPAQFFLPLSRSGSPPGLPFLVKWLVRKEVRPGKIALFNRPRCDAKAGGDHVDSSRGKGEARRRAMSTRGLLSTLEARPWRESRRIQQVPGSSRKAKREWKIGPIRKIFPGCRRPRRTARNSAAAKTHITLNLFHRLTKLLKNLIPRREAVGRNRNGPGWSAATSSGDGLTAVGILRPSRAKARSIVRIRTGNRDVCPSNNGGYAKGRSLRPPG